MGLLFSACGILGARHSSHLDEFGIAFMGAYGDLVDVEGETARVAEYLCNNYDFDSMTFSEYVSADIAMKLAHAGEAIRDINEYLINHGMDKIPCPYAIKNACQYSQQGVALGVLYPQKIRHMYERTHAPIPKDKWESMHAAGLNIPQEQDLMSYEEAEEGENESFMQYCVECCPELCSVLEH